MATVEQTPGELNISVVQGDDLSIQLTEDSNFSGYTFIATIHQLHGSSVTCATSFVATAASSTVQVDFPAVTTGALPVTTNEGAHNWKCVYTDVGGLTRTWMKGTFTVLSPI